MMIISAATALRALVACLTHCASLQNRGPVLGETASARAARLVIFDRAHVFQQRGALVAQHEQHCPD
jgi:hypothetical protein